MNFFEKNFEKVSAELEKFCKNFRIKGVPEEYQGIWTPKQEVLAWQVPKTTAELLKGFVLMSRARIILELGTSFGFSTLYLAAAARANGGKVYTVELIKPKLEVAKKYFNKAKLSNYIVPIESDISRVLKKWRRKIDFLFLDADKTNYLNYLKLLEPYFHKGTVLVADNALDYKYLMKDYTNYLAKNLNYYNTLLKIDHGLLISVVLKDKPN